MRPKQPDTTAGDRARIPDSSRHERGDTTTGGQIVVVPALDVKAIPDRMTVWMERYQAFAVAGVRSPAVAAKTALHLERFRTFFQDGYGHDRLSVCLQRDVAAWQRALVTQGLAPATVNNHLASLSAFTSWVYSVAPGLFPLGDPAKGVSELGLPPLEPRSLSETQVRSLKNLCDRLPKLAHKKGRRWANQNGEPHVYRRPWRDRALVFLLLSTGLRREEVVLLNLDQVEPHTTEGLRRARRATVTGVQGKAKSQRTVFLSADARAALADYLEKERATDATETATALFLSAQGPPARREDGRLSVRAINRILEYIGRLHDAEVPDASRRVSPLRPHDLRHTFAFQLARVTNADAYELERRLGHRSGRYISRYTNPPEAVAAGYVEDL
jgi:integrase